MDRVLKRVICVASLLVVALPMTALAQPFVPVESYNRTRPDFGNKLPLVHVVCLGARRRVFSTHAFGASTLLPNA